MTQGARSTEQGASTALALEAHGVCKSYETVGGRIDALAGVDLHLQMGELLGLVGPNGSGKTTLVRALMGVVKPDAGSVWLGGDAIASLQATDIARRVAVVPQDPQLPPAFTALECVLMGRTPHLRLLEQEGPADMEIARRSMLATQTWELAERPVGELSGGERQRVIVARALAQGTSVLLLDEPTAHLDIGHQGAVLELMRGFTRREGKAVLAVVHDLTLAAHYCDRIVVLKGGRVIGEGAPSDVLRSDLLREVYGVPVAVMAHPETGRPVVAPADAG